MTDLFEAHRDQQLTKHLDDTETISNLTEACYDQQREIKELKATIKDYENFMDKCGLDYGDDND
jgi:hypothetical protein